MRWESSPILSLCETEGCYNGPNPMWASAVALGFFGHISAELEIFFTLSIKHGII